MSAEKLTQESRAAKIEQGLPASVAQREAEAIVAEKKAKTLLGLAFWVVGAICAAAAHLLFQMTAGWVFGFFLVGFGLGIHTWDTELVNKTVGGFAKSLVDLGAAIGKFLLGIRGQS
mgnify:CR=1 FL=1